MSADATATGRPPARTNPDPARTPPATPAAGARTTTGADRCCGFGAGRFGAAVTGRGASTRDEPPDSAANTTPAPDLLQTLKGEGL